ncbi:hypothetical protein PIB30_104359, partial [Stylosanthes scabra]|nr:hypothetical protein [Stylosanthes scabra]
MSHVTGFMEGESDYGNMKGDTGREQEQQEEHDSEAKLLHHKSGMEISKVVVSCITDLAFKFI